MAPATTSKATAAQAKQLLDVLRDLTTEEFQRLLRNGDVLRLLAKNERSDHSARMLREYASGYVSLVTFYGPASGWERIKDYTYQAQSWYVRHNERYVPMLEHYGIRFGSVGMERRIREHWLDYGSWYIRIS